MKIIKTYMLFILQIFSYAFCVAQDVRGDLLKMNEVYLKASSISMNVQVAAYGPEGTILEQGLQNGSVKKSGDLYYSKVMGKTSLSNKNCTLFIDDAQKIIVYSKPLETGIKGSMADVAFMVDSVFFANNKIKQVSATSQKKVFEVIPSDETYKKIELVINAVSYALEQVTYFYKDGESAGVSRIQITYSEIKFNEKIPASVFSEKTYISRENGKISAVGKWASYTVIDQSKKIPDGDE